MFTQSPAGKQTGSKSHTSVRTLQCCTLPVQCTSLDMRSCSLTRSDRRSRPLRIADRRYRRESVCLCQYGVGWGCDSFGTVLSALVARCIFTSFSQCVSVNLKGLCPRITTKLTTTCFSLNQFLWIWVCWNQTTGWNYISLQDGVEKKLGPWHVS